MGGFAFRESACGLIAQLVEQLTLNQLVVGSNPSRPTKFPYLQFWHGLERSLSGFWRGLSTGLYTAPRQKSPG